jgi:phage gp37-like protein
MNLTLEAIEDAMKARITAASSSGQLGYRINSVATYAGEFDDLTSLAAVIRALPGVWLVLDALGKPERKGADKWKVPATFVVMVGARNPRSAEAARHGSQTVRGLEPGSYRMLQDMWDLFAGQDMGIAVEAFKPGKTVTVFQTRVQNEGISVLGLELHTSFMRVGQATKDEANAPELKAVGFNYYLKPGDDVPDATDNVKFGGEEEA